jgi:hypothetical protein
MPAGRVSGGRIGGAGAQGGKALVAASADRDRVVEAADLQDPPDLVVAAADREAALAIAAAVDLLPGAHDQGDPGRNDQLSGGEVDHHRAPGCQRRLQLVLERGRGVEIQLAADSDDADAVEFGGGGLERVR